MTAQERLRAAYVNETRKSSHATRASNVLDLVSTLVAAYIDWASDDGKWTFRRLPAGDDGIHRGVIVYEMQVDKKSIALSATISVKRAEDGVWSAASDFDPETWFSVSDESGVETERQRAEFAQSVFRGLEQQVRERARA